MFINFNFFTFEIDTFNSLLIPNEIIIKITLFPAIFNLYLSNQEFWAFLIESVIFIIYILTRLLRVIKYDLDELHT